MPSGGGRIRKKDGKKTTGGAPEGRNGESGTENFTELKTESF